MINALLGAVEILKRFSLFVFDSVKSCSLIVVSLFAMVVWSNTGVGPLASAVGTVLFTSFFAFMYLIASKVEKSTVFMVWLNTQAIIQMYFWADKLTESFYWLAACLFLLTIVADLAVTAVYLAVDNSEE